MTRIRPDTRKKIDRLRAIRGWSRTEALDRAADALLEKESINPGATAKPKRSAAP